VVSGGKTFGWSLACHLYPFANGASRTYTFRFTSPVANDGQIRADAKRQISLDVSVVEEQPGIRSLYEQNGSDNYLSMPITLAS
jgi:hypothetical protein